ncbi:GNAT family N-acetyltransferase [Pseudomonas koreensis]|jgi:GNAT superfamily N-acetyltransferase|uniref:Acetyltransferase n=1 Tax=Pseudomonas moraviensis R28-S TaxID=1395516 RepID=V8RCN0_9PSED|nr:GNAT family N-acetyltransferase [Pseudomonas moraviensis]ETF09014.1 acetyltransferase [Pseudomonas moraviensis R28-S]OFJ45988.1 GNAT family N-acetyltransferase [Pseudomonas koreensis]
MRTEETPKCEIDRNLLVNFDKYKFSKTFSCGVDVIDSYYKGSFKRALKSENISAIGAIAPTLEIVAFCTLTVSDIDKTSAQNGIEDTNLPSRIPVVRLVMLGVDVKYQGWGIGQTLLMEAFKQAARVHKEIPIKGVYLDAAPTAVSFYEGLGFKIIDEPDTNQSTPMLIGINVILEAIAAAGIKI